MVQVPFKNLGGITTKETIYIQLDKHLPCPVFMVK